MEGWCELPDVRGGEVEDLRVGFDLRQGMHVSMWRNRLEMEKLPRAWLVGMLPCDHLEAHGVEQFATGQHQG